MAGRFAVRGGRAWGGGGGRPGAEEGEEGEEGEEEGEEEEEEGGDGQGRGAPRPRPTLCKYAGCGAADHLQPCAMSGIVVGDPGETLCGDGELFCPTHLGVPAPNSEQFMPMCERCRFNFHAVQAVDSYQGQGREFRLYILMDSGKRPPSALLAYSAANHELQVIAAEEVADTLGIEDWLTSTRLLDGSTALEWVQRTGARPALRSLSTNRSPVCLAWLRGDDAEEEEEAQAQPQAQPQAQALAPPQPQSTQSTQSPPPSPHSPPIGEPQHSLSLSELTEELQAVNDEVTLLRCQVAQLHSLVKELVPGCFVMPPTRKATGKATGKATDKATDKATGTGRGKGKA